MTTGGETNLQQLLRTMAPEQQAGSFVFLSFAGAAYGFGAELEPVASCMEHEGLTLIVPLEQARRAGHNTDQVFSMISLSVHSSLEAVGLTATISTRLTANDISANIIAGYYHDHVFVARADAERAVAVLCALAAGE